MIIDKYMDSLPIELLDKIASHSSEAYYGLLGYKFFADTLNYNKRVDYMILFGYSIEIRNNMIEWSKNGKLHRIDGPALEEIGVREEWYQNGEIHRDNDLPASIWLDGHKIWYRHGKLHRDNDLPAEIDRSGTKCWYQNGKMHRYNDLPAIECEDGYKAWYQYDVRHRDKGPAVEWANGYKEWFKNGLRDTGVTINT